MGIRLFYGFLASCVIWLLILHFTCIPVDRYLPPAFSMRDLNVKTTGYIVNGVESGYSDHWWNGNLGFEWYLNYKFQPTIWVNLPSGGHEERPLTTWQTGTVAITEGEYKTVVPGAAIPITYDPWNPLINGETGTGKINMHASWFSGWLWYLIGFIATAVGVGELLKKWIKPPE
jgi:hypothetical protein